MEVILGNAHDKTWMYITDEEKIRRGPEGQPNAIRTAFGWTVSGNGGKRSENSITCHRIALDDAALHRDVERIFYNDFPQCDESEVGLSRDQISAKRQLDESCRFDDDVRKYTVGIPWKAPREETRAIMNAADSEAMCLKRLRSTKAKFEKDPALKERAFRQMEVFEKNGYAIDIEKEPGEKEVKGIWNLPIHIVEETRNGKLKTRICHDARASADGVCLNELMLGGWNLINPLADICMNFRKNRVAITGDIEAFFHNVRVDSKDVHAFRYWWFSDKEKMEPRLKLFLSHVFGSAASSFVTSYVLHHHAELMKPHFPENIIKAIKEDFYVDDYTGGAPDVPSGRLKVKNLTAVMEKGGFPMAKWRSNKPEIFEDESSTEGEKQLGGSDREESTKVLGMSWRPKEDVLTFTFDEAKLLREVKTPRALVSVQASIYDPIGLLAPYSFKGRRMLQQGTAGKPGWDSRLLDELRRRFEKWASSSRHLMAYSVPRWWSTEGTEDFVDETLHIFGDASLEGYGAVAYRRVVGRSGEVFVTIVYAKTHVVPLDASRASHHNHIPRLELVAAEKTVLMRLYIERALKKTFGRVFLWSDSESALKMIFNRSAPYRIFFKNRLSKIHSGSVVEEWNKVEGSRNPADFVSRGLEANDAEKWRIFHNGPDFLWKGESDWPKLNFSRHPKSAPIPLVYAIASAPIIPTPRIIIWEIAAACSGWSKKIRRVAIFKKFILLWKLKATKKSTRASTKRIEGALELSGSDYVEAERLIVESVQKKAFGREKEFLTANLIDGPTSRKNMTIKNSKITRHNPFVGTDNIIRVGSRLVNATIKHETKFPAILPQGDPVVKDLIRFTHAQELHSGPAHVQSGRGRESVGQSVAWPTCPGPPQTTSLLKYPLKSDICLPPVAICNHISI